APRRRYLTKTNDWFAPVANQIVAGYALRGHRGAPLGLSGTASCPYPVPKSNVSRGVVVGGVSLAAIPPTSLVSPHESARRRWVCPNRQKALCPCRSTRG